MRASRKKFSVTRNLFLGFLALVAVATVAYINFINPLFSRAASSYMTATITDDNGTVDFSPGNNNAVATFSYMKVGAAVSDSKIYAVKIALTGLPTGKSKTLKVTLPIGMAWVDDASGDSNLTDQLESTNGITSESLNVPPVLGYTFDRSGSRVYHILESSTALVANIQVKADRAVSLAEINDAIKATLSISGESDTVATLKKVSVPTGATTPGNYHGTNRILYAPRNVEFQTNEDLYRRTTAYVVAGLDQVARLYTQMSFKITVSDPRAIIKLNADNDLWSLDSSDAANGNYTITFTPDALVSGIYNVPYTVTFGNSIPVGTEVQLEYHDGHILMWTPSGPEDISFGGSKTIRFVTLPDEASVAVGQSSLNPNLATNTTQNGNRTSVGLQKEEIGILGYSYINNRGATDSASQTLELNFNTNGNNAFGVMAVVLPCGKDVTKITSVDYKTHSNNTWRTATIAGGKACSTAGTGFSTITYADLGLTRPSDSNPNNFIKAIRYNLGVVPKGTQLMTTETYAEGIFVYGRRLNANAGQFTVQSYSSSNNTGITTVNTPAFGSGENSKDGAIDLTANKAPVEDAGSRLNFQWTVSTWGSPTTLYPYNSPNPVIYIRSELKDGNGNFLPINDIKVRNSGPRGNEDITSKFGQITYKDTATARIYKLDGRNVTDGSAAIIEGYVTESGVGNGGLIITYSIDTDYTTPDQLYNLEDALHIQDTISNSFRTHSVTGDPFGVSDDPDSVDHMVHAATNVYYQVRGFSSIGVDNSARRAGDSEWTKWNEGDDSIITSGDTNIEMKTTVMNNSGVAVTNPTIVYVPIPKKGENWGALGQNGQAFNFSMALTGAVTKGSGTNNFTVTYGTNVTPSDDGETLNGQSAKFAANPANWDNVNCIKIVANNIPANPVGTISKYDFTYTLKTINTASATDGTLDTWRPVYYQNLVNSNGDNFAGWKNGNYVSLKLVDGKLNGKIFLDTNENGKLDSGESALNESGWSLALYNKSSNELVKTTTTNSNGEYSFGEIPMSANGYYITVTNKHPINGTGTTYLFTPKGTASNTGSYNTDNQAAGDQTSSPIHKTAKIDPISPSMTAGQATYNIGVVAYSATESYSGKITFSDLDNSYNTRPASVTITAVDNESSSRTIEVPTNNGGNYVVNLPKYNSKGQKLSYSLSAPALVNYNKSEETTDNGHRFNVTYTLKTSTLRTHYYKVGTTEKIAEDTTTPLHYGQTYTALPLEELPMDYRNYELVSATPSGYTGVVNADEVVVTFYYQKKDATLSSDITVDAPEVVDNKLAKIKYDIAFSANVVDYVGPVTITITGDLPYPIIVDESELDGGTYNATAKTITWTETFDYNSYRRGILSRSYSPELVFEGALPADQLTATFSSTIALEGKSNAASGNAETAIKTPATIIFKYVDQNGNEIQEEYSEDGFVGDTSDYLPPEIPGYRIIAEDNIDLVFGEEVHTVTYRYEKIVNPNTSDYIFTAVSGLIAASLSGFGIYLFVSKRR